MLASQQGQHTFNFAKDMKKEMLMHMIDGGLKSEAVSYNLKESTTSAAPGLSTTEKQELQNKMAKLMAMLDEVCDTISFAK
jgi:hypothetical protein